jgi:hypothetical protein
VFNTRNIPRSGYPKKGLFWLNWSMKSGFASEFVNRKAHRVVIAAKYVCVKLELIKSNIIAVATLISSLSTVYQPNRGVFLAPRFTGANREPLSAGRWDISYYIGISVIASCQYNLLLV